MKKSIKPGVAVILVIVILGGLFGMMYAMSEAPKSNHPAFSLGVKNPTK